MFALPSKKGRKGVRERALQRESGALGADRCSSPASAAMSARWVLGLDTPGLIPVLYSLAG